MSKIKQVPVYKITIGCPYCGHTIIDGTPNGVEMPRYAGPRFQVSGPGYSCTCPAPTCKKGVKFTDRLSALANIVGVNTGEYATGEHFDWDALESLKEAISDAVQELA